ncbi:phospholipid carrier-dependent glycosyltransferase [Christensenella timonensis]|uniref:phospholipid carrier-dependent glycosyltransferase n=1 Tax=Christensenella timonensis TaxID=1816678 RepID=UPI00082BE607|nr:phospholipid carrier-dependent glycosyltransferase [Christensenella timonensis]
MTAKLGKTTVWDVVRREHIIFLALVFVFYFFWSLAQPPLAAPDEGMRYQIPQFLFENGYLPHGAEEAIRNPQWGISYGFAPYVSQILGVPFMKIAGIYTSDPGTLVVAARLVNVIFATLTVWISFKIAARLFGRRIYRLLFVVLVAFLPQFIFLSSYINNDMMAIFSTSLIVLAWVSGIKDRWPVKSCVILGIGMGLCALSYYNAYGFLLLSVVLFFASNLLLEKRSFREKEFRKSVYIVAGLFLAIAAWWFIRNYIIYDGDILGFRTTEHYQELYAIDKLKPSMVETIQRQGIPLGEMLVQRGWLLFTYLSMVGCFGAMDIWLPVWVYAVYTVIFAVGMAGCIMALVRFARSGNTDGKRRKWLLGTCMVLAIVIPVVLSAYYSYTSDYQPQGRYILSCLIPLMLFMTVGIKTILEKICKNKKSVAIALAVICLAVAGIAVYCYFGVLLPAYP